jgi:hypothetical protein
MATDYELWATQHGGVDSQPVQVLEFKHDKWGSLYLCDYGKQFAFTTETGGAFVAEAVGFEAELPKESNSTQSEMTLRVDALGGYVMSQVRAMTDDERKEPIALIWRLYLDTHPNAPQLDPLTFVIVDISASRLVVEFQCAATALPNIAAGTRYTLDNFPTLAYL